MKNNKFRWLFVFGSILVAVVLIVSGVVIWLQMNNIAENYIFEKDVSFKTEQVDLSEYDAVSPIGNSSYFEATKGEDEVRYILDQSGHPLYEMDRSLGMIYSRGGNNQGIIAIHKGTGQLALFYDLTNGQLLPTSELIKHVDNIPDARPLLASVSPESLEDNYGDAAFDLVGNLLYFLGDGEIISATSPKELLIKKKVAGEDHFYLVSLTTKKMTEILINGEEYPEEVNMYGDQMTVTNHEGLTGVLAPNGRVFIPLEYASLQRVGNLFYYSKEGKNGVMDSKSRVISHLNTTNKNQMSMNKHGLMTVSKKVGNEETYAVTTIYNKELFKTEKGQRLSEITNDNSVIVRDKNNKPVELVHFKDKAEKSVRKKIPDVTKLEVTYEINREQKVPAKELEELERVVDQNESINFKKIARISCKHPLQPAIMLLESKAYARSGELDAALDTVLRILDATNLTTEEKYMAYAYAAVYASNDLAFSEAATYAEKGLVLNPQDEQLKKIQAYAEKSNGIHRTNAIDYQKLP